MRSSAGSEAHSAARAAYLREWYGLTFGDPANYDLCIDTSALGEDASGAAIVIPGTKPRPSTKRPASCKSDAVSPRS